MLNGITSLLVLRWRNSLLWMIPQPAPRHHGPTSRRHILCHADTRPEQTPDVVHTAGVSGPQEKGTARVGEGKPRVLTKIVDTRDDMPTPLDTDPSRTVSVVRAAAPLRARRLRAAAAAPRAKGPRPGAAEAQS